MRRRARRSHPHLSRKDAWAWSHARAHDIFNISEYLCEHDDVLTLKLVEKRVTFAHRGLWPAILGLVTNASWRRRASSHLSHAAQRLFRQVQGGARPRTDLLSKDEVKASKELETALLIHAQQVHTEDGHHATILTSWGRWPAGREIEPLGLADARVALHEICGPHVPQF